MNMGCNPQHAVVAGLLLLGAGWAAAEPARHGTVSLEGRALRDAGGSFLGLGATYMQALRHCKYDRPRLDAELAFLSRCGFNYVRVLSMVDWPGLEISPVDHKNREGHPVAAWPDYEAQLRELVDIVFSHGLRTQVTIFADAQHIMPDPALRRRHAERVTGVLRGSEGKVILYEIANEAWQNGFPGDGGIRELRELGGCVAAASPVLLALSAPFDGDNRADALARLYAGSRATVATVHFSRDLRSGAGPWLPVVDCWDTALRPGIPPVSSNEPIGPGASVASEDDPELLLAAAAFAYVAGLPMYVFHSGAGVMGERRFESMSWLPQFKVLPDLLPSDLPNWDRYDGDSAANPLSAVEQGLNPLHNCGARRGRQFVQLPLALPGEGRLFRANSDAALSVYELSTGRRVQRATVQKGQTFTMRTAAKACIIKGEITP